MHHIGHTQCRYRSQVNKPEPRYSELTAIPRPLAGHRREREEEMREGETGNEWWETSGGIRREQGKGKGGEVERRRGRCTASISSYSPVFTKQFQTVKSSRSQRYEELLAGKFLGVITYYVTVLGRWTGKNCKFILNT